MFGNLFESSSNVEGHGARPAVIPPRSPCGLCGLQNQGATCYLNTLIQTLLYTPEFRESLLSIPLSELEGTRSTDCLHQGDQRVDRNGQVRVIPLQLQRLFARLLLLDASTVSTSDLTLSFGWREQEELYQQQDVQELNRILFVALERSLVGTSGSQLVSNLHRGTLINQVQCLRCKNVSQSLEDFLDLTMIVSKDISSLEQSLCASFLEHENMKGNNQYFCSQCTIPVDAQKSSKIKFLPPILTFSILRFNYDFIKGQRYKETSDFSFPMELDMGSFCAQGTTGTHYELFSIIIHSGSSFGGHYHAYIKDIECLGLWNPPPSSETVIEEPLSAMKDMKKLALGSTEKKNPVTLISAILEQHPQKGMSIDNLCQELINQSRLSWNKQFKKSYGPIIKFLQKYDDVFTLNEDARQVFLKNKFSFGRRSPEVTTNICNGSSVEEEAHWFDFNDGQVHAIRADEIPKLFRGTESAYMLCYRSSALVRPSQALENRSYAVPDHLLCMVSEENAKLLQEREHAEKIANSISVYICFGYHHHHHQGALQPREYCPKPKITIDKNSTLQHLRELIYAEHGEQCETMDFSLYRTSEVLAGLHLEEHLSNDKTNLSLTSLLISNDDLLLVANGVQVLGIPVGPENQPLLLSFTCYLSNGEQHRKDWAFPKSSSVAEVKVLLSSILPTLKLPLRIYPSELNSATISMNGFPDDSTLEGLKLQNEDQLFVCESISEIPYMLVQVHIRNTTVNLYSKVEDTACPRKTLSVERNMDILSVKIDTMLALNIDLEVAQNYRLRKVNLDHSTREPPLHETQRLGEIFPKCLFGCLVLEEGAPPAPNEITLLWRIGDSTNLPNSANFPLDCSIQECLDRICTLSGLNDLGKHWHLCKSNQQGEPLLKETLSPSGRSLEGLKHGSLLYLQEGPPVPSAFLSLQVRLTPAPPCRPSLTDPNTAVSIKSQCQSVDQLFREQKDAGTLVFLPLGQVELSASCTLLELKKQILTLPPLNNLHIPSARHLRLCLRPKNGPVTVLRGLAKTLGNLNLNSEQILWANLLEFEEDLMPKDVILNVIQHPTGQGERSSPQQVIWAAGRKARPASLLACVSDSLRLNASSLLITKYSPEKDNFVQLVAGDGAYDKTMYRNNKADLRLPPYSLKDEDTIAVKDCVDTVDKNSISPIDVGHEPKRVVKTPEAQVQTRRDDSILPTERRASPKPEVGISIHVDDFS